MESELQSSSQEMHDSDSGEKYAQAFCRRRLLPFPLLKSSPSVRVKRGTCMWRRGRAPERASSTRLILPLTSVSRWFSPLFPTFFFFFL